MHKTLLKNTKSVFTSISYLNTFSNQKQKTPFKTHFKKKKKNHEPTGYCSGNYAKIIAESGI